MDVNRLLSSPLAPAIIIAAVVLLFVLLRKVGKVAGKVALIIALVVLIIAASWWVSEIGGLSASTLKCNTG